MAVGDGVRDMRNQWFPGSAFRAGVQVGKPSVRWREVPGIRDYQTFRRVKLGNLASVKETFHLATLSVGIWSRNGSLLHFQLYLKL